MILKIVFLTCELIVCIFDYYWELCTR